jgi:hypothetical protein
MKLGRQTSHDCPVPGCPHSRLYWKAVCDACWRRLPEYLRGPIEAARRAQAPHRESAAASDAVAWLMRQPAAIAAQRLGESSEFQRELG